MSQWTRQETTRTHLAADRWVITAGRAETVQAGLTILQAGGNAADAAVAMAFVAAVVEPTEASIGGSGFMVVHGGPAGDGATVEFPPRAPLSARADSFELVDAPGEEMAIGIGRVRDDANAIGYRAPSVPGFVAGMCLAHARFGTLPLAQLLEPAIGLAQDGFEVDAYLTLQALASLPFLRADPSLAQAFLLDGLPKVAPFAMRPLSGRGPIARQPELAESLRMIARDGADAFYRGEIADAIHEDFAANAGLISREDLAAYRATVERPVAARYRDATLLCPRAPNGAWTVLQALKVLDRFALAETEPCSPERVHLVAAALQTAFADRYHHLADPEYEPVPLAGLLSDPYADELARTIDPVRAGGALSRDGLPPWVALSFEAIHDPWRHDPVGVAPKRFAPSILLGTDDVGHGTTHLNVIDGEGCAVSCTITLGETFGAKVTAAGTGVLFDSGMSWFNPRPGAANSIAPGKRPLVNMAPLVAVLGGESRRLAVGAAGGRRIISAVAQAVVHALLDGFDAQSVVCAPRIDGSDRWLRVSARFPAATRAALSSYGWELVTLEEQHEPFAYDFGRLSLAALDEDGKRSGGIGPFTKGFVAGA